MEEFLLQHPSKLHYPKMAGDETIFEYVVGDNGRAAVLILILGRNTAKVGGGYFWSLVQLLLFEIANEIKYRTL